MPTALASAAPDTLAAVPAKAPGLVEGLVTASRLGESGAPMLQVALALANAGWPVFPCRPDTKQPLTAHGFKDRSNDIQRIERWWSTLREATVGIVPADGGLVALDVDKSAALTAVHAAGLVPAGLLDALKARTPEGDLGSAYGLIVASGGTSQPFEFEGAVIPPMHWYYRADSPPRDVHGVTCRYDKGYVIAPGSRGIRLYRVLSNGDPMPFASTSTELHEPRAMLDAAAGAASRVALAADPAPDAKRVLELLSVLPAPAVNAREECVDFAYAVHGALANADPDVLAAADDAFLRWAARWPGAIPEKDELIWDSTRGARHRGWRLFLIDAQTFVSRARAAPRTEDSGVTDGADLDTAQALLERLRAEGAQDAFEADPGAAPPDTSTRTPPNGTQATALIRLARTAALFHTPDNEPHALVPVDGHVECWPLRSDSFVRWLKRAFYRERHKAPSSRAATDALGILESLAQFDSPEREVFVRVARQDDAVYIDIANEKWQAIKVTPAGWEIVDQPPVAFCRPAGMLELPIPTSGGSLDDLWPFVNIVRGDRPLVAGVLVSWLAGHGPYIVACLIGPQGSAKSVTSRMFRALVDPSEVPLRAMPRDERDLAIAAANNWLLAFDNASYLPGWLSDAMCRITSGAGFATRGLYTDRKEILFKTERPQIMNGIEDPVDRDDLRDRAVFLFAPLLEDEARRDEATLWQAFEAKRARILGGLLDLVSRALRNLPDTKVAVAPRMADFVRVGVAAGIEGFYQAYLDNRNEAIERGISGDPLAERVRLLATSRGEPWEGTATELLAELNAQVGLDDLPKWWPRTARALSGKLRRLLPSLRHTGVVVEMDWPLGRGAEKRSGIRVRQVRAA